MLVCILVVGLVSACSGKEEVQNQGVEVSEGNSEGNSEGDSNGETADVPLTPTTIKFGVRASYLTEGETKEFIIDPVKEKYPHITVEIVWLNQPDNNIDNLIINNQVPDIIVGNSVSFQGYKDLDLQYDINDLIDKHNFDLNRFQGHILEALKIGNGTDYLVAFPYSMNFNVLFYNIDIFDKFAIPYPEDGMTWYEVTELAKRVTREDEGVQYRGFEPDTVFRPGSQLGLPFVDDETYTSLINTDEWARVYKMVKDIYDIPGNEKIEYYSAGIKSFIQGTVAMNSTVNYLAHLSDGKDELSNWDMVSYPVWPEKPTTGSLLDAHVMMITSSSDNKDDAFRVMETVVSDEVQIEMARNGRVSVLEGKKFEQEYGKNIEILQGKNVEAIFKTTAAIPSKDPTIYFNLGEITASIRRIVEEDLDINTALRELEEQMNQRIAEERSFGK